MAYTQLQTLRKSRAENKGTNRTMAVMLRRVAAMLDAKGPEEFTRSEIRRLQNAREAITHRLYANACTKGLDELMNGKFKIEGGLYTYALDKKDL